MTKRERKRFKGMNAAVKEWVGYYRPAIYDRYGNKLQTGIPYVNRENYK